jgi:hypothetical protein
MADKSLHRARTGIAATRLGVGTHSQPSIVFTDPPRDEGHVSSWTLALLGSLMATARVTRVYVTSTYRSPQDQARVMLGNLTPGKSMYAGYGQRVERVAQNIVLIDNVLSIVSDSLRESGFAAKPHVRHSRDDLVRAMASEIERLERHHGEGCVSRHQADPNLLNVVDLAAGAVTPQGRLSAFIDVLTRSPRIARIGLPKGSTATHGKQFVETQNCIHLEIPQLNDAPFPSGGLMRA